MENSDLQLIMKLIPENKDLKRLWEDHLEFENKLEQINIKKYLSTEDEIRRKQIQKLKLAGKDKIEEILRKHRNT
ncbi:MAG: DUF465 domain-containing protein [Deltaproteobacteria bacterium]|nr:DUF465 domain-containing protein [Deltaproteobacteria bacterium]